MLSQGKRNSRHGVGVASATPHAVYSIKCDIKSSGNSCSPRNDAAVTMPQTRAALWGTDDFILKDASNKTVDRKNSTSPDFELSSSQEGKHRRNQSKSQNFESVTTRYLFTNSALSLVRICHRIPPPPATPAPPKDYCIPSPLRSAFITQQLMRA